MTHWLCGLITHRVLHLFMLMIMAANDLSRKMIISCETNKKRTFTTAIMRRRADLTIIQHAAIEILHKEAETLKDIAEQTGCSQSAVSKHFNGKLGKGSQVTGIIHIIIWDVPACTCKYCYLHMYKNLFDLQIVCF